MQSFLGNLKGDCAYSETHRSPFRRAAGRTP